MEAKRLNKHLFILIYGVLFLAGAPVLADDEKTLAQLQCKNFFQAIQLIL